jgi:hypothetical protein
MGKLIVYGWANLHFIISAIENTRCQASVFLPFSCSLELAFMWLLEKNWGKPEDLAQCHHCKVPGVWPL